MEAKKKSKYKFNFFDAVVIVLIALLITGFSYIYLLGNDDSGIALKGEDVEYKLEIELLDNSFSGLVKKGDKITDNHSQTVLGEVIKVDIIENDLSNSENGVFTNHDTMILTIKSKGVRKDSTTVEINGYKMRLGSLVEAHSPLFTFSANCVILGDESAKGGN